MRDFEAAVFARKLFFRTQETKAPTADMARPKSPLKFTTFSDWLSYELARQGKRQADLVRGTKLSKQFVWDIVSGRPLPSTGRPVQPSRDVVDRIATFLGADIYDCRELAGHSRIAPGERAVSRG